jgi:Na+/proline symporter
MQLAAADWLIIVSYLVLSLIIGLYYRKRASRSMNDFFLGGRSFPWYLAGLSMVATTFAADTPLAVNELVSKNGISGNWLWWNMLIGGMLTTFFFARLWSRSGILTEVEFIEFRYSGPAASFLRGFKAIYLGLFMNTLIMGWVNLAMMSILEVFFSFDRETSLMVVAGLMLLTAAYSAISGLWGVAVTDAVQFIIAMAGCIILAVLVVQSEQIGGISGLKEKLPAWSLDFFPTVGNGGGVGALTISIGAFLAYLSIWAMSWYPGAEPGGGGYVAQRMMSAKSEKDSLYATLFFQVAHYCIRPWPWILVGLCTIILYPDLPDSDKKLGYVMAIRDFMPVGLKGLLLVAFLAAYMSTIATQLNWGTSYLVNDLYKRFIRQPKSGIADVAEEQHYVKTGKLLTLVTMLISIIVSTRIESISEVWSFIIECGAGLGIVLILRWYWWRINAWSELTATIAPFVFYGISKMILKLEFPNSFFITAGFTTICWLIVTYISPREDFEHLRRFYDRVRPGGWWKPIQKITGDPGNTSSLKWMLLSWMGSVLMTYSILFCSGKLIFMEWSSALGWAIMAVAGFLVLRYGLTQSGTAKA